MSSKRFVDLSLAIAPDLLSDPPDMIPKIDYKNHVDGVKQMKKYFPGITKEQLPP